MEELKVVGLVLAKAVFQPDLVEPFGYCTGYRTQDSQNESRY